MTTSFCTNDLLGIVLKGGQGSGPREGDSHPHVGGRHGSFTGDGLADRTMGRQGLASALAVKDNEATGSKWYGSLRDDDHMADTYASLHDGHAAAAQVLEANGDHQGAADHQKVADIIDAVGPGGPPDRGLSDKDARAEASHIMAASNRAEGLSTGRVPTAGI